MLKELILPKLELCLFFCISLSFNLSKKYLSCSQTHTLLYGIKIVVYSLIVQQITFVFDEILNDLSVEIPELELTKRNLISHDYTPSVLELFECFEGRTMNETLEKGNSCLNVL